METYKNKILAFYEKMKRMPTYTEIMRLVGFKSKNAVHKLVNKLVQEGIISKDSSGRLLPTSIFDEVPLLGLVEAGFPTDTEQVLDSMSIDNYLIRHRDVTYLLRVKGDSMIDAGIRDGDLVIAEKKSQAKEGDIVIAEVDGGWTMKYLRRKDGKFYLEPANRDFDDIYPEQSLNIGAIVRGVIRKY